MFFVCLKMNFLGKHWLVKRLGKHWLVKRVAQLSSIQPHHNCRTLISSLLHKSSYNSLKMLEWAKVVYIRDALRDQGFSHISTSDVLDNSKQYNLLNFMEHWKTASMFSVTIVTVLMVFSSRQNKVTSLSL